MIEGLFGRLSELMAARYSLALLASFLWGILSILLSPCHLSSIPLIIGYLASQENLSTKRSFGLSLVFAFGVLITIAMVGVITASLGRLIGDVGIYGNILVAVIFLVMGLYLLDVIRLNWNSLPLRGGKGGLLGALGLGLLFGIGLGPCTFAYLAPVLGIVFSMAQGGWLKPALLIFAFAIGHCGVIALAGGLSRWVQEYLNWSEKSRTSARIKKGAGLLVLLGGLYFIYTAFLQL
jgi:cytochrome c-type biogenesis protein